MPLASMVGSGTGSTVTKIPAASASQPNSLVTVTVYNPDSSTTMVCVVSPVFHKYASHGSVDSETESPSQKVVGPLAVITGTGVGVGLTVMSMLSLPVHPLMSVTCTQ